MEVLVAALLCCALQLLAIELLQLLSGILINGVNHVQHLNALLAQRLEEWRGRHPGNALAGDVEDVILTLLQLKKWVFTRNKT